MIIYSLSLFFNSAFADYSSRGRPWDADDNYDSSSGIWFVLFIVVVGVVFFLGASAKHTWDNHKTSIKDGLGIVAFIGICILLFLCGKACSEQHPKGNDNAVNVNQYHQSSQGNNPQPQPRQQQSHTEYYYEPCPYCNAKGYIQCSHCNGVGVIPIRCSYCGGSGKVERELMTGFSIQEMCPACFQTNNFIA